MNTIAHLTFSEAPLWLAVLVVGIGLGMALAMAMWDRVIRRK